MRLIVHTGIHKKQQWNKDYSQRENLGAFILKKVAMNTPIANQTGKYKIEVIELKGK